MTNFANALAIVAFLNLNVAIAVTSAAAPDAVALVVALCPASLMTFYMVYACNTNFYDAMTNFAHAIAIVVFLNPHVAVAVASAAAPAATPTHTIATSVAIADASASDIADKASTKTTVTATAAAAGLAAAGVAAPGC